MKRILIPTFLIMAMGSVSMAQSAIDALTLSQTDFKGTARFMSMGGAFTALGGDLSTLTQNPAGLGIYRHSEIGATLDIDMQSNKSSSLTTTVNNSQTKAYCNNFGYVGVVNLDGPMKAFQWGVTYGRTASFDRIVGGYQMPTSTSLTNYIASFTNGVNSDELNFGTGYNPYSNSDHDWMSILAFNSYMINNRAGQKDYYQGLYQNGTTSDAMMSVREKGYVDEYAFDFAGNVSDVFFWGLGISITDLNYTRYAVYSESMNGAAIYDKSTGGTTTGNAEYTLTNFKHITGTGWNVKFGVIFKPINELRIGGAIHSPTWYSIDHAYDAEVSYDYYATGKSIDLTDTEYTDPAGFSWRLQTPWRFMLGVAGVVDGKFILSADYERQSYSDIKTKYADYDGYGGVEYFENTDVNNDIKNYTNASNIFRVGAEYRVTPQLSLRAGYNLTMSSIKKDLREGYNNVITSGSDPSYNFDKDRNCVSFGLGYRFGAWYIDGTYVRTTRESTLHAFTDFDGVTAPRFQIKDKNNSLVFSLGFRF